MIRRAIPYAFSLLLILLAPALAAEDNLRVVPKLTSAQWRADLHFFSRELPKRHANAFHFISRERFEAEVAQLDGRLERLDADEIYAGLDRIACLIGDGHTYIQFPDDTADMPLEVGQFGTEFRVTRVLPGLEKALGTRVLKVQGRPVDDVHKILLALTPQDETPTLTNAQATSWLTTGIVLHGLGVTPVRNAALYTLADDDGHEFTIEARAIGPETVPKWIPAFREPPLFRQKPTESFWYRSLPGSRTIYCNFRSYKNLRTSAAGLLKLVDDEHPDKLVIDLRQNGGGDYELGLRYLIRPLRDRPAINKRGHLFVLIGPATFSAAMSNSAHFRAQTAAMLVGRPIGEKPNSYQESRRVKLPNSGLTLRYSVRFYKFVESGENIIRPDQEVVPTWAEHKAGRDPVLEWVMKYPAK
jgi:hypothetical protein